MSTDSCSAASPPATAGRASSEGGTGTGSERPVLTAAVLESAGLPPTAREDEEEVRSRSNRSGRTGVSSASKATSGVLKVDFMTPARFFPFPMAVGQLLSIRSYSAVQGKLNEPKNK